MTFLRNAWYCAGFSSDLEPGKTRAITMLGEPVVLYRKEDGAPVALADRCPHRFAPLSLGRVCEGQLQCGYHGLRFDASGQCTHNPHGDGAIPKAAQVRAYPVLERHQALWVWMGDAAAAAPALLPDFTEVEEREGWSRVEGYVHVRANYQLMNDNLLDLTHVPYLHPLLGGGGPPPPDMRVRLGMEQVGDSVLSINELDNMPTTPLYQMVWERGAPPALCSMRANMRWYAPSLLLLNTGATVVGGSRDDGPSLPIAHWLTPETEMTTHYFWAQARNRFVGDAAMDAALAEGVGSAFRNEDEPMIEACQRNMGTTDLMSLKPLLLQTDGPATRARRIVEQKLKEAA
jgi:phenylpropionate dioxygenase-like ring-hydroxylating dioxygenase large terminal subunit